VTVNKTFIRAVLIFVFFLLFLVPLLALRAAPLGSIQVNTSGIASLATNVQTAPYRLTWSGTLAVVSTAAAPITINGARVATTQDLVGITGTFTNLNIGGSNYTSRATIKAGTSMSFGFDGTSVTFNASGVGGDLSALSNGLEAVGLLATGSVQRSGGTMGAELVITNSSGNLGSLRLSDEQPDGWPGIGFARPGADPFYSTTWFHMGSDGVNPRITTGGTNIDFVHEGNLQSRFSVVTNGQAGVTLAGAFSGNATGLTNLPISATGATVTQTATGTVIAVTGGGGSAFRVALIPAAAVSGYGSTNDATLLARTGTNASWSELQFSAANIQRARWPIPAAQTMALAGGSVTCRVSWYTSSTTGAAVWAISLRTCNPNGTMDAAYSAQRIITNQSSATVNGLTFGEWVFTPATNEITAGQMTLMQLQRQRTNTADNAGTAAQVIGVSLWQ
jgi:hypothetical protein